MAHELKVIRILTAIEHWYTGIGSLTNIGFELGVPADSFMKVMVEQNLCTPDYHPSELASKDMFIHALLLIMLLHERNARSSKKRQT